MIDAEKKYRVVFPFVEAGLGHIMPMKAIADVFENKYGEKVDVVRTNFFTEQGFSDLIDIEKDFAKEVKLHNKCKFFGFMQFLLMKIFGSRLSMKYLMEHRYKKGFALALDYIKTLDADIVFNTHFSTLYYACEARSRGLIDSQIMAYCPDPIIGRQWDNRLDLMGLSSEVGRRRAIRSWRYSDEQLKVVPFFIRSEVKNYDKSKQYYRDLLGLPEQFTILLADGAYGAGKLKKTVYKLLKSSRKMNIIAVCGKNERLYKEFCNIIAPQNITFIPYGFTDKMLTLSAACDLFVGKAGASNLAEPIYFGAPAIVTYRATPIERWICAHYVKHIGCAVKRENITRAVKLIEKWVDNPSDMLPYQNACISQHVTNGAEQFADEIWARLLKLEDNKASNSCMNTKSLSKASNKF